jgi:hypothetical protein
MKTTTSHHSMILIGMFAVAAVDPARADGKEDAATAPSTIASGRLSQYGITAGVAFAVFAPTSTEGVQRSVAAGAMPYIEVRPTFLARGDITRAYCVARHTVANPQQTADAIALKKSGLSIATLAPASVARLSAADLELLRGTQAMGWVAAFQASPWSAQEAWIRQFVEDATGWKLGTAGACGWASDLGLYLGRPATYKANARYTIVDSDAGTRTVARRQVDVDPMISFGVTYSPVSEVRLMAGLTLSNAVLETDGPASHVWALTFAVGGNLDIVGALIPK